eukprot:Nk52_evm95s2192 gene=Nk52_evmTU95s2192
MSDEKIEIPLWAKSFAAGVLVAQLNKRLVLGALVGTAAGIYVQQYNNKLREPYEWVPDMTDLYRNNKGLIEDNIQPLLRALERAVREAEKPENNRKD